ncbi:excisionase family DNA-binding protein [Haloferula chungangensis]|uniref:Excisionase family DNA-binding protein n=1 Tax=Haloferula chungangensis TaxID=1048331 RepID=A0ABW2LDV0_9BACT
MITTRSNRLDPSLVPPRELDLLASAFTRPGHIALIDDQGNRTEIPEPFFRQLARITRLMREGRAIVMVPEEENFTTQAAANYLGMSRQHLVTLLEDGKIPFHRVGTHRRVTFKDLLEFESKRDAERRSTLDKAFDDLDEAGLYDNEYTGDRT